MTATLSPEVRTRLDAHLDAVERALLAANNTRERRRGIVDDLEAQILDMLAAKSEVPTMGDLEQVLSQLDPPSAYGENAVRTAVYPPLTPSAARPAATPATAVQARFSRCAIWGFVLILMSMLPLPLVLVGLFFVGTVVHHSVQLSPAPHVQPMPEVEQAILSQNALSANWAGAGLMGLGVILFSGPLALAGTVLGWIALGQIHQAAGALRGTGLALFDALFFPILMLVFSVLTPFFLPLLGLTAIATCIAVIYIIVRVANGQKVMG